MLRKFLALGLIVASTAAWAQVSLFDMGLGTRAMGLGGAYAALAEGPEGLLYNPAGLAKVKGIAVDSTILAGWVGAGYVGAAIPSLGAGIGYLGTSAGEGLGFSQFALIAGLGLDLRMFGFPALGGVALRFQNTDIAGEGASGIGLDLGVLASFPTGFGEVRAAMVLRELAFGGLSTEFVLAGAWVSPFGLFATLDLTSEYVALGVGWGFMGTFEVRAGLRQEGVFRLAFGLGARFGNFSVDYALLTHPLLFGCADSLPPRDKPPEPDCRAHELGGPGLRAHPWRPPRAGIHRREHPENPAQRIISAHCRKSRRNRGRSAKSFPRGKASDCPLHGLASVELLGGSDGGASLPAPPLSSPLLLAFSPASPPFQPCFSSPFA